VGKSRQKKQTHDPLNLRRQTTQGIRKEKQTKKARVLGTRWCWGKKKGVALEGGGLSEGVRHTGKFSETLTQVTSGGGGRKGRRYTNSRVMQLFGGKAVATSAGGRRGKGSKNK